MPAGKPALDLTEYDFVRTFRDLTIYGTWMTVREDAESEEEEEPCLVLCHTLSMSTDKLVPCVVLLSEAWRYDDPRSGHHHLLSVARRFVTAMRLNDNMANVHMIADAIHSHLLDLIKIPPKDHEQDRTRGAEATIVGPDGKRLSIEAYDDK